MPTLWEYEADFIRLVAKIKKNGIKIDRAFCEPKLRKGKEICLQIRQQLGWNPGSSQQIGEYLINELKYPVLKRTEKGNPSFDKHALEEYDELLEADGSDIAKIITRYRGWQKTYSSNYEAYLKLADKYDIIHPNYKQHGTRTGRLSCENPNLQQIPRESEKEWNGDLKQAFIPRTDSTILVEFDYGQLETRLTAAVAREQELLEAFRNDVDVFQVMADSLGWKRQPCKTLTYMTMYGAGPRKVAMIFGLSIPDAAAMIEDYYKRYPNIKKKAKQAEATAKRLGYIKYWTGRRRHLKSEHHKAFNAYIQGGAFEIVKRAGLRLNQKVNYPIVLTVHDSYVLEMPLSDYNKDNLERVKFILEDVPERKEMGVPFKVTYKKWGEK